MWSKRNCFSGTGRSSSSAINPPDEAGRRSGRALCLATLLAGTLWAAGGQAAAGGAVKLTDGAELGGTVGRQMDISPDGTRVVFTADTAGGDIAAVFSVPITGGTVTQLSGGTILLDNYTLSGNVFWIGHRIFDITPDGLSVIYESEPSVGNVDLKKAPIAGGPATTLASLATDHVEAFHFDIASDSAHVVYSANDLNFNTTENRVFYSVPTAGGQPSVTLFDVAPQTIGVLGHRLPTISPDSQQVICNDGTNIYIQAIGGGPVPTLGTVDSDLEIISAYFTGDGSHVIYDAMTSFDGIFDSYSGSTTYETHSVRLDGTNAILLSSSSGNSSPVPIPPPKGSLPMPYVEIDGSHLLRSSSSSPGQTEFSACRWIRGTRRPSEP